jgi:hypothetical protein
MNTDVVGADVGFDVVGIGVVVGYVVGTDDGGSVDGRIVDGDADVGD